ncbi:nucleotide excision repair endonuclease [Mammaliicoccus sciuri]|uniref:GIY-YIG catalytic domain-containing protein n=2 Tax=Sporosarcina newyorkensis TaxID=759851 RepID=A0A1T4XKW0_9BACL|nr:MULTISPECIES: nucleotide excision repair endonuclease [Sporosarcina]EGQ27983.1 excinuclease ABC subunit C [Sporosarcina newyorkensis 2681]MBY0222618.1 nucleotide excision repair endonuclease [Sporosarcina aquimarina]SKA90136.1 GIY-YIG catalytic domain-containing protein [Sporosarcina newyorkensis]
MITIQLPEPAVTIVRRKQELTPDTTPIKPIFGFIDFHEIPRDKGGLLLFYNQSDELLFVGKARKLRPRLKKHFEDQVSPLRNHREEVAKIAAILVDDPMEREIYETYVINTERAKYNTEKAFYRD